MPSLPAYNTGIRYNSGARYGVAAPPTHKMATVKLELDTLDDDQTVSLGKAHKKALTESPGNAIYLDPQPSALSFDADLAAYDATLTSIDTAEKALEGMRATRDVQRLALQNALRARGIYVQGVSAGDAAKIAAAAFAVQATGSPTTSMPTPQNVKAVMGKKGEIKVTCKATPKAKSYTWRCREHVEGQVAGPWQNIKSTTTASIIVPNLTSGKTYAFAVMVLGPNNTESDWSDEAICMAP